MVLASFGMDYFEYLVPAIPFSGILGSFEHFKENCP